MNNMKLSKYNYIVKNGENYILYNCYTDQFMFLLPELNNLLHEYKNSIEELDKIHPDFFQCLLKNSFIIESNVDEAKEQIEKWEKEERSKKSFTITINPTMNCNMRCWYCYEEHRKDTQMSEQVLLAIQMMLNQKVQDVELEQVHISFFGGEPLLSFDSIVYPLLKYANEICTQYNKQLHVCFTTNAYLLTDEILSKIETIKSSAPTFFQITLDGNKRMHNRTRFTVPGNDSYEVIVEHIHNAVQRGMYVSVRLNYTLRNILSFIDIIDDFKNLSTEVLKNLEFAFHPIWQDPGNSDPTMVDKVNEVKSLFMKEGLTVTEDNDYLKQRCYADYENCIVVNYNGDLYKCTARDFKPTSREGQLSTDGTLLWNELYAKRMLLKYSNNTCLECSIFPICHGGCTQDKLENEKSNSCLRNYSQEDKENIINKRIVYLSKMLK